MLITLADHKFNILFHHKTKLGRRPQLYRGSVRAVTTCVVFASGPGFPGNLVAIDNALCSEEDTFSRPYGCALALKYLLDYNSALRNFRAELWNEYHRNVSGIEDCPTCKGQGWMMDGEGEACRDCLNELVLGGTGLKGGRLLVLAGTRCRTERHEAAAMANLLIPMRIPTRKPAAPKLADDERLRRIAAGAEKREGRQIRRRGAGG